MLDAHAIYHTGFVVSDLQAVQAMFSAALGVEWAPVHHYDPLPLWIPGEGWTEVRMRVSYSRPMPHQIELIEGAAGSFYDPARTGHARHVGLWTDDVGDEVRRLLALGWTLLGAKGAPADNYGTMAYMMSPRDGAMLELVSTKLRPMLLAWFDEPCPD